VQSGIPLSKHRGPKLRLWQKISIFWKERRRGLLGEESLVFLALLRDALWFLPLSFGVLALLSLPPLDHPWFWWQEWWGRLAWPTALAFALIPFLSDRFPPSSWSRLDPRVLIGLEIGAWSGLALWTAWQGGVRVSSGRSVGGLLGWSPLVLLRSFLPAYGVLLLLLGTFLAGMGLAYRYSSWQWTPHLLLSWWLWLRAQIGPWLGWHLPDRPSARRSLETASGRDFRESLRAWWHRRQPFHSAQSPASDVPPIHIEADFGLPPHTLLEQEDYSSLSPLDVHKRARLIQSALTGFGVPVRVVEIHQGPAVTQFCVQPLSTKRAGKVRRVSVKRIVALQNDLALILAASPIRIEAPVPGKSYVGIEVPNPQIDVVRLGTVLMSPAFQRSRSPLAIALGRDVAGNPVVADLAKLPHLLIAGATGSGKSVAISTMIVTWIMRNTPHDLRLLLVDPKRVELTHFSGIPHLLGPVVTDGEDALRALAWIMVQMDDRYRQFALARVRNIGSYNRWAQRRHESVLPYLVIVIDELADIMLATGGEVEHMLARLAQMARATGIHLVAATQRPSVDVITGLIKANFPARLAFAVASQVDSRVILDMPGAEALLGRGDALFLSPERPAPVRLQGSFISDEEIGRVVSWWKAREGVPEIARVPWANMTLDREESLTEKAIELVRKQDRVSASYLQRKLHIGFKHAQQLIEELESMGVVGPDEGGGRGRAVLVREKRSSPSSS